ncbi:aegerolysin type Hemolysin [Elaphomyces granulatus]
MAGEPRGEAQWVTVNVINSMSKDTISVKDANLEYGKFYKNGDKSKEIPASEINEIRLLPGEVQGISSCGRQDSPSGTDGHIILYDGDTKICRVYWDCPWGKPSNKFGTNEKSKGYFVDVGEWNQSSGAIGKVDVEIGKKG